jgi:hypothetical protein
VQVLASLHPWIANIEMDKKWQGTPTESLLSALYALTERHGSRHAFEAKQLWHMAVDKAANFSAVLDYVLQRVVNAFADETAGGDAPVCFQIANAQHPQAEASSVALLLECTPAD